MTIAICDDNIECINIIENYINTIIKSDIECDAYFCGEELVAAYKNKNERYDIVFLDMEMEKLNGIDTANIIREFDEYVIIIFVTSHSEYMKESFKCQPFRFIEKPIELTELQEAFDNACKKISKKRKVLTFNENKTKIRLYCDDIIYCESQAHWILIYTKERVYKLCKTMTDLYEMLDKEILFRIHKSFIVNYRYVKSIKDNDIRLYHCDKLIPIGRSYKKNVIIEYTNFIERNLYV